MFNMKLFCIFALALVVVCSAELYTTENDNLDIAAVVADQESLKAFVNCFVDKGDCDAVTSDFKKDMAEAIKEACSKCTDAQKHIFKVFLEGLKAKLPTDNTEYRQKFDPENKFFAALEAAVAGY